MDAVELKHEIEQGVSSGCAALFESPDWRATFTSVDARDAAETMVAQMILAAVNNMVTWLAPRTITDAEYDGVVDMKDPLQNMRSTRAYVAGYEQALKTAEATVMNILQEAKKVVA